MENKRTNYIASLSKGLRVIECFDADAPRLSVTDVASRTGLDRATSRRCLLTLHRDGYADYDGKFFTLTPQALRLGMSALNSFSLPQIVQPWLDQLSAQIKQSCSVAILERTEIVYLARAAERRVMSVGLMPGSRLPAHCTSLGRVLLANMQAEDARSILEESDLTPRTLHSLISLVEIEDELSRIREHGFAFVDQEVELGLRSIAVPVFNGKSQLVAALNTGMALTQSSREEVIDTYLPALQTTQSGLKRVL